MSRNSVELLEWAKFDKREFVRIIGTMKTAAGVKVGGGVKARQAPGVRALCKKVAKFVDDLIVKYYYKGERLRPEVRERIEKSMEDARQGKNLSPAFTNAEDAIKWLRRNL